ncbi:MAG: MBL fold metallo-hydrolase, partial [Glaciecola sp.]
LVIPTVTLSACHTLVLEHQTTKPQAKVELVVLGVAQDAGYPQIACYQPHCMPAWENPTLRRSATALGVLEHNNKAQYLFEATPQMPQQLYHLYSLTQPNQYALNGVMLTHAHMGHYTGLMFFGREAMGAKGVPVYAMPEMRRYLETNGPWSQLVSLNNISLKPLTDRTPTSLSNTFEIIPLKVPHRDEFSETVGYIGKAEKSFLFIPDIDKWNKWEEDLAALIRTVDYAFLDATFYGPGELPNRDMSEVPHPFVVESMEALKNLSPAEKNKVYFIHLNHSNPLLNKRSAAYAEVIQAGFNVAEEGMRFSLD